MFINIVFWLGCDKPSGLHLFVPVLLLSILKTLFLPFSPVSLSYLILSVPMCKCSGKRSCLSSPFLITILNGTSYFLSLVQENINMPSGHYYRLFPEVAVENHLICRFAAQPALQCAIRGTQGVLPCVGWGVRPVNWIYRLWRHCP